MPCVQYRGIQILLHLLLRRLMLFAALLIMLSDILSMQCIADSYVISSVKYWSWITAAFHLIKSLAALDRVERVLSPTMLVLKSINSASHLSRFQFCLVGSGSGEGSRPPRVQVLVKFGKTIIMVSAVDFHVAICKLDTDAVVGTAVYVFSFTRWPGLGFFSLLDEHQLVTLFGVIASF